MKRCSKCDKSDHTHCKRGECECLCQEYPDLGNQKQRVEPERATNPEHDEFFEQKMKEWRELQESRKPKLLKSD